LEENLAALKPHQHIELVPPEVGGIFRTLNNSLVYVFKADEDDDFHAVVLQGGHGDPNISGGEPGERYLLDDGGCYRGGERGSTQILMSLGEKVQMLIENQPTKEQP